MKLMTFAFLVTIISISYSCKHRITGYEVQGDINGLQASQIYMQAFTDSGFKFIDSTPVNNGKFAFKGDSIKEPFSVTLFFNNKRQQKEPLCSSFYLENGETILTGNINKRGEIKIEGSGETSAANDINKTAGFSKRYIQIQNIFFKAENTNTTLPADSVVALRKELDSLEIIRKKNLFHAIKKHSDSHAALYTLLNNVNVFSPAELQELHNQFSNKIKQSLSYQQLNQIVNTSTSVNTGSYIKDFMLSDTSGMKHALKSFRGQILLVDFWASWCGPCRKQIPALKAIYKDYEKKGFKIIGVSVDEEENKWKGALIYEKMPWLNLLAEKEDWAKNTYLISSIPANFLLDKEGKIIGKDLSVTELNTALQKMFD
jgi:thiol-disulfide isomerase/thioredoxin